MRISDWSSDVCSSDLSKDIEEIVREYRLSHPEVILESVQRLQVQQQQAEEERRRAAAGAVRPVSGEDHVMGSPDASVKVIEFSDFECPFCKGFHRTMGQVMEEYGQDGKVDRKSVVKGKSVSVR